MGAVVQFRRLRSSSGVAAWTVEECSILCSASVQVATLYLWWAPLVTSYRRGIMLGSSNAVGYVAVVAGRWGGSWF